MATAVTGKQTAARLLNQFGIVHSRPQPRRGDPGRVPDFIGIGAQRCGTSWLFSLLVSQRGFEGPVTKRGQGVKELHFFDGSPGSHRDLDDYRRFFPYSTEVLCGEWTPSYFYEASAVGRLAAIPEAVPLFLMLRDPSERARSGLKHESARHLKLTPRLIDEAVQRSSYGRQWNRLTDVIDEARITVLQFESATRNPEAAVATLLGSLGKSDMSSLPLRVERNGSAPVALPQHVEQRLHDEGDNMVADLCSAPSLLRRLDTSLWPTFERR